ncbi:MAG: sulfatase-like hydrolase/transferase [Parabacteroides sp.]|nr:sulfatase-like hydrolase/transferase [Parabacteroides sp.]
MKRKHILLASLFFAVNAMTFAKKEQKNVLFILVDDMQKTSIHAYGNSQVVSPNIDNIINNGVSFMHTYTNGSVGGALSMPSRAMIMTGRSVFEVCQDGAIIPEEQVTLPELLRGQGYETFATGKWHADKKSFNRSFQKGDNIFFGGMHQYNQNGHVSPRLHHYDATAEYKEPFVGDKFSSQMFADAAVSYLEGRKKNDKPFFAFVAFTSPHDPRNQHPDYGHKYNPDEIQLPVNYLPQHPFDNGELKIRDEVLLPFPRTEEMIRKDLADYYGMISEVDVQIGRIIDTLRKRGELDNTIIIFAADNGLAVGRHGLLGKQNLYEHSISVPMAMVVPGMEKGGRRDAACYLYDIYPTVCDLLNVKPSDSVTGRSLLPVLNNGNAKHRDQLFLAYNTFQRALVKDNWKYILYNVDGVLTEQLFDLNNDPDEMVNLAGDSKYDFKKKAYRRILKDEMKRNGDFCDLDSHFWTGKPGKMSWKEVMDLLGKR